MHWLARLLVVLFLSGSARGAVHAVLIGIDNYEREITPLRYTVNDVTAFRDVLIDPRYGNVPKDNCILMTPQSEGALRPSRRNMLVEIKRAALRTQPGDTLILYFAGHGMQTAEGQFLLGVDADPLLLADTAVPLDTLPRLLQDVRADTIVVIIDACRNDPDAGRATGDNEMGEAFARSLRPRLLAQQAAENPNRRVATWLACDVGERAWEITAESHGVFSYHLLTGLKGACKDTEGKVRLLSLANYVELHVAEWARQNGRTQTPRLDNPDNLDFVITVPNEQAVVTPAGDQRALSCVLKITSTPPGATVRLDNEGIGVTPLNYTLLLPDGQAREAVLTFELEGYQTRRPKITLEPGATIILPEVELTRAAEQPVIQPTDNNPGIRVQRQDETEFITPPEIIDQPGDIEITYIDPNHPWDASGPDGMPMVRIPAGQYRVGRPGGGDDPTEGPQHTVELEEYYITAMEVTNQGYANYLNAVQATRDPDGNVTDPQMGTVLLWTNAPTCGIYYDDKMGGYVCHPGMEYMPVVAVTWLGAASYALAYGMTLPTEAQWEVAAQGTSANTPYAWGPALDPAACNTGERFGDVVQVNAFPNGASRWGALNMVGNVAEWTRDYFRADYHRMFPDGTYEPWVGETTDPGFAIAVRGASYLQPDELSSIWTRAPVQPNNSFDDLGFRCVLHGDPADLGEVVITPGGDQTFGQGELVEGDRIVHPDTAATFVIPDGYAHQFIGEHNVLAVVHAEDEENNPVMAYFKVDPTLTDHEEIWDGLEAELENLGCEFDETLSEEEIDTQNGNIRLWRRVLSGWTEDMDTTFVLDVVQAFGVFHGIIYACPTERMDAGWAVYSQFLTAISFPRQ